MSTDVPFSTFTIRIKVSYSQSAFCHSILQPFANVIIPKQGAPVLDCTNERWLSVQYETLACALLAPARSLREQGRSQPMLGILVQFMETSLLFLSYSSSSHPHSAVETDITQRFWHLTPCPLLETASSNDCVVGTQL